MLVPSLATTQYNTVSSLDQFQLSEPNLLALLGRTQVFF